MKILKKENWWVWLLLFLFSSGTSNIVLGALLDVFDKKAWYAKWQYWVIGLLLFVFPASIMLMVFYIQIMAQTAAKLDVPGKELYLSPYIWIACLIVPLLGWTIFTAMTIYIPIMTLVMLYRGAGEKYLNSN